MTELGGAEVLAVVIERVSKVDRKVVRVVGEKARRRDGDGGDSDEGVAIPKRLARADYGGPLSDWIRSYHCPVGQ